MDIIEDIGHVIDGIFDAFTGPKAQEERARSKAKRRTARGEHGYVIVFSEAPKKLLRWGKVFRTQAELGKTLRAAAKYLRDEDPHGYPRDTSYMNESGRMVRGTRPGGFMYYKTEVRRLSDGQERQIDVSQSDVNRKDWLSRAFA